MLRLSCKLRLNSSIRAKCDRHRAFDPSVKGQDYVQDRCATCRDIQDLYDSYLALEKAIKNFERRAGAWESPRPARQRPDIAAAANLNPVGDTN